MKPLTARGIILTRTDFGEADRIVTLLTPDHGKLRLMARGVRKVKSKLAGGIELFSVSDITFIKGRGEIDTLVSTRLHSHYGHIVQHLDRVQLGYDLIKLLHRATEDHPEPEYFMLLEQTFQALDDPGIGLELIRSWFEARLLDLGGHAPNLQTDAGGAELNPAASYDFDFDAMSLTPRPGGALRTAHIKTLRLLFGGYSPAQLARVADLPAALPSVRPLLTTMLRTYITR